MIFEDKRITYAQLQDRVNRLANALGDMGVGEGDRVAMLQVNCNEQIEAYFAAAKLDAVYVPMNFRARTDEIVYMLNDSGPKALFVGERYIDMIRECADQLETVEHFIVLELYAAYGDNQAAVANSVESAAGNRGFTRSDRTGHSNNRILGRQCFLETRYCLGNPGRNEYSVSGCKRSKRTLFQSEMLLVHTHHWQFGAKQHRSQGVK